jgi:hypothetical protein
MGDGGVERDERRCRGAGGLYGPTSGGEGQVEISGFMQGDGDRGTLITKSPPSSSRSGELPLTRGGDGNDSLMRRARRGCWSTPMDPFRFRESFASSWGAEIGLSPLTGVGKMRLAGMMSCGPGLLGGGKRSSGLKSRRPTGRGSGIGM